MEASWFIRLSLTQLHNCAETSVFCFHYYDFFGLLEIIRLKKGFMLTKITEKTQNARISMLYVCRELTCYVIDPALTVAAL